MAKISRNLAKELQKVPQQEPLEVVLELGDDAKSALDSADSSDKMRHIFSGYSDPVKKKIKSLGGDVTGEAWINGTLRAKLTQSAVESFENDPDVSSFDLPDTLERE